MRLSRVLLIEHGADAPEPDRVRRFPARKGRRTELLRPFAGDALPATREGLEGVAIHGGAQQIPETDRDPYLRGEHALAAAAAARGVPILGICPGAQCLAHARGARVAACDGMHEFGCCTVTPTEAGRGFLPGPMPMPQSHFHGSDLPPMAERLAMSPVCPHQAFRPGSAVGIQFHPEVTPGIMRHWQRLGSAPRGDPGAELRPEPHRFTAVHDGAIDTWCNGFLAGWAA
ncbi:MAG: glutamine amidotransferase [Pararhodobacter sp.]